MKGVYCLIIGVRKDINSKIGALGNIAFAKGTYAYVGSAQNNLKKRIERHKSKEKKKRWHIDYLLASEAAQIKKVLWKDSSKEAECELANKFSKMAQSIKSFGCSDCRCQSHLFKLKNINAINKLRLRQL